MSEPRVLPDLSAMAKMMADMKARLDAVEAENASLKRKGLSIAWAKDHEGKALVLTWPGKRGRYIEVGEFEALRGAEGESVEAWLKANKA